MPVWTVYSRADCSLCERMLEELAELLGPQAAAAVQVVERGPRRVPGAQRAVIRDGEPVRLVADPLDEVEG